MNTYLTANEIEAIKAIKAQYLNESNLSELTSFLKKNGKDISTSNRMNTKTVWNIILDSFTDSVINHPAHRKYKEENPNVGFSPEKNYVIENYLSELNPKLDKIYDIAYTLNFDDAIKFISQKTESIQGFDIVSFLLNSSYDFKPYSIDSIDSNLIDNTIAIDKTIQTFFDGFTKGLNIDQRNIVKRDFLQTITYFIENSTPAIKKTDEAFKPLVEYINTQSI